MCDRVKVCRNLSLLALGSMLFLSQNEEEVKIHK